jgi:hypothetical protein
MAATGHEEPFKSGGASRWVRRRCTDGARPLPFPANAPAQGNWRLQEKLLARQITTGYNCKHDIDTNQRSGDRGYGRGQRFTRK